MKNKMKKLLSVLLCAAMTATATPFAMAEDEITATVINESDGDETVEESTDVAEEAEGDPVEDVFDVEAAYEYVMSLADSDEINAYLDTLSDDEYQALETYAAERAQEEAESIETVVFTDAGQFMSPINIAPQTFRLSAFSGSPTMLLSLEDEVMPLDDDSSTEPVNIDGVVTNKTVSGDGSTITIEAYVTGETTVTSTTTYTPVDIVLVLDQSGSMAFNFNGDSTNTITERRQYAMKQAVNNFIASVGEKYNAESADHRIAIVTFASSAQQLQGWTFVNEAGVTSLQNEIAELPDNPTGATNVADGMQQAENLMDTGYNYTGTNTTRQKVVIVFTDGVPTTASDFDTTVATNAISSAKNLKDDGVTVYSIGIFNGVDPNQLYGDKVDYTLDFLDEVCDGEPGSRWGADFIQGIFGDVRAVDIAAGNRFLNYISSNFADADEIGIKSFSGLASGWEITRNFERTASEYYLTAEDAESLSQIFQSISDNIQTGSATVQLGTSTVIKDVISDYFDLPTGADAGDIEVYTADYNSDGTWADKVSSDLAPTIDGKTITVTGFDFSANYCDTSYGRTDGNNDQSGDFYGRKLIMEIPIVPEPDFLGGAGVPTNGENSGVYVDGEPIENFEVPTVDIAPKEVTPIVIDQNIYLTNSADLNVISNIGQFEVNGTTYTVDGTNNAYVDLVYTVEAPDGTIKRTYTIGKGQTEGSWVGDESITPEDDVTLNVTCTTVASSDTYQTSDTVNAQINVFVPELTFKDSTINLGATADYDDNYVSEKWVHVEDGNAVYSTDVTMSGDEPTLALTYNPTATAFDVDTPVAVTVKIGVTDVTSYVQFVHKDCNFDGCAWEDTYQSEDTYHFIVHINSMNLTITKSGCNSSIDENQSFVFTVEGTDGTATDGVNMTVVVHGNSSVTITGLPVGDYTVTEDTNWSWRYTPEYETMTAEAKNAEDGTVTVTFENERNGVKWLNGCSYATNKFTANTNG